MDWKCKRCGREVNTECIWESNFRSNDRIEYDSSVRVDGLRCITTITIGMDPKIGFEDVVQKLTAIVKNNRLREMACTHDYVLIGSTKCGLGHEDHDK